MKFLDHLRRLVDAVLASHYPENGNRKDKIFIHLLLCIQPTQNSLRVCLHRGGGPQIGEVTCGRSQLLSCKRDQIKMRDYMDRRDTPPNRVNSPTWGEVESPPPPPLK